MPVRFRKVISLAPVYYATTLWDCLWSFQPPEILKLIASKIVEWFPSTWTQFWQGLRDSDQTSFGFWIRHRTDRVVGSFEALTVVRHEYGSGEELHNLPEAYRNLPPNTIRLIEVKHAENHLEPLMLDIAHNVGLPSPIRYTAISYVWGSPEKQEIVYINNQPHWIPYGTAEALRYARCQASNTYMWCDALCINQRNVDEREIQVSYMEAIFGGAQDVVVFLGPDIVGADPSWGMDTIDYLLNDQGSMDEPPWERYDTSLVQQSLADIMQRPWFGRYWTIQELVLSKNVHMMAGLHFVKWKSDPRTLFIAIQRIKFAEITPQWKAAGMPDLGNLSNLLQMQYERSLRDNPSIVPMRERKLLDVLYRIEKTPRESTDRRDRFFALLGLVPDEELSDFKVNYTKSLGDITKELFDLVKIADLESADTDALSTHETRSTLPTEARLRRQRATSDNEV